MKLPFTLICIDLETTDTDSTCGSVIQIGAVRMTNSFEESDSFNSYIKPLTSHRNPQATAVHKISEDVLVHAPELNDVLEMFENFVFAGRDKQEKIALAAWGNYFDVPFLKEQYEKIGRKWPFEYRSLDLKAIVVWEFAKRNIPLPGGVAKALEYLNLEFDGIQHDALADIKNSIRILQKILLQEHSNTGW